MHSTVKMNLGTPVDSNAQTRSISPENFSGGSGKAGCTEGTVSCASDPARVEGLAVGSGR